MERLTNRLPDGTVYVVSETGDEGVGHFTTQRRLPELVTRLAAYEDTGLAPEEIRAVVLTAGGLIAKMAPAKKAKRVLQYAPGDIVYDRKGMAWTVEKVEVFRLNGELRHLYCCYRPGTDDSCFLYAEDIKPRWRR